MPFTLPIGHKAPDFHLPATDGKSYALKDFAHSPLLVICFTCNHCPYVIGNESREKALVEKYHAKGVAYVAINSNNVNAYADDDFPHMVERARSLHFTWPYLHDESQAIAKAYGAIKTPHFYLFDKDRSLRYVGRMDNSPRDKSLAHTHELADAVEDLLTHRAGGVRLPVSDAIGCTVKWRGKDKHFIPNDACDLV
jgi:peroxiredoxin